MTLPTHSDLLRCLIDEDDNGKVTLPLTFLGGGLKYFLEFSSLFGEDSQFDSYYSDGLKPPTSFCYSKKMQVVDFVV